MTANEKYLVHLSTFVPFGPVRTSLLVKYFGSAEVAWKANRGEFLNIGLKRPLIEKFLKHRARFKGNIYFDRLKKLKIDVVFDHDKKYPSLLKQIDSHPRVLYTMGRLQAKDKKAIAIVGSRKMTSYGKHVAAQFSEELARSKITIVSGMARGVDSEAHKGAIRVGGRTIAVLGSGLNNIYPPENKTLSRKIIENGCLVSEYPLGYPAFPYNFVARNRIISGLSRAVMVVEGRIKSGTLLTVKHALDQGRPVFAIPGQINSPMSEGPHFLIREGAILATKPKDILDELNL